MKWFNYEIKFAPGSRVVTGKVQVRDAVCAMDHVASIIHGFYNPEAVTAVSITPLIVET